MNDLTNECLTQCPYGRTEDDTNKICVDFAFCSSQCNTCTTTNDPTKCIDCPTSSIANLSLNYLSTSGEGSCALTSTNNAQHLITIDKNSLLGTTIKSVTFNGASYATPTNILAATLYSRNVIEFSSLSSNTIKFNLISIPIHKKIYVRVKAATECITEQNRVLKLTLTGTPPITVTQTIP